jgi:zinc transport system substrate-binding protein
MFSDLRTSLPLAAALVFFSTATTRAESPPPPPAPLTVVSTIFPLYDWARIVGGDRVRVTQLLPAGVEAHSYAPRPSDLLTLHRAHVFLFLGDDLEPWAHDLIGGIDNPALRVIEAGQAVPRTGDDTAEAHDAHAEHLTADHDHEHDHAHHGPLDPHVWLDPVLAQSLVAAIADGLAAADPAGSETYRANAARYQAALQELHARNTATLATAHHREILYGGHFAFGYFARRYSLTHRSPYTGFSPNASPTPTQMADLIRAVRSSGQQVIFHEELLDPRVARVIAAETGARLELLHAAHNLTRAERDRGDITYLSLMNDNLAKLRLALEAE